MRRKTLRLSCKQSKQSLNSIKASPARHNLMPLIKIDRLLNCSVKYLSLIILLAIIAVSLEVSSCKNVLGPTSGQSTIVFPDSNVSYYRQVLPLFEESCDYSGCHDDGTGSKPERCVDFVVRAFEHYLVGLGSSGNCRNSHYGCLSLRSSGKRIGKSH